MAISDNKQRPHGQSAVGEPATLLRILLGKLAHHHHQPTYEAIVLKALEMHLAGATVLQGSLGFGTSKELHKPKLLHLTEGVPVTIEIVDRPEKIEAFLPVLADMMTSGTVILESVQIVRHRNLPLDPFADVVA